MVVIWLLASVGSGLTAGEARSHYPSPPPGGHLVVLQRPDFAVHGDGVGDDTVAFSAAIAAAAGRGTVLLVPSGTYRLSDTIVLPKGMRVLGVGAQRPRVVLAESTPGWDGERRHLIRFGAQHGLRGNDTFFSVWDNLDIEIAPGNPAAIAVYYEVAQGCLFANSEVRLQAGNIGLSPLGSEITNCRFIGGDVALMGSSWAWQVVAIDCTFSGQRQAAALVQGSGLTLVRCAFSDLPVAVEVPGGKVDRIAGLDNRFTRITQALVRLDARVDGRNQVVLERSHCTTVMGLAALRGVGTTPADPGRVDLRSIRYGAHLTLAAGQVRRDVGLRTTQPIPRLVEDAPVASDLPRLPDPATWIDVTTLGVRGDGTSDDTVALRAAVANHRDLYLPPGRYRLSDTLTLAPDTRLIGLHPRSTQLVIAAGEPGFGDAAAPRALLQTPPGGTNLVTGIGIDPQINPGAIALRWQAGASSYLGDFWIEWSRTGDHGTSQHTGLWIDGGGGVFRNLTISHLRPPTGLRISDTAIPGRVYGASLEHKHGTEIHLRGVRGWEFIALQTEHSQEESATEESLPLLIEDCADLRFLNLYLYRTSGTKRQPATAVRVERSHALAFDGVYSFSNGSFTPRATIELPTLGRTVTERTFATFTVEGD